MLGARLLISSPGIVTLPVLLPLCVVNSAIFHLFFPWWQDSKYIKNKITNIKADIEVFLTLKQF
jgi:hypothetical protein